MVLTSKWIAVSILWSYERCWKQLLARWGTYKLKNLSSKALVQLWGNNSHWESYVFPWNTHASLKVTFLSTASNELFNVTEKNKYIISCYVCQISLIDWRTFMECMKENGKLLYHKQTLHIVWTWFEASVSVLVFAVQCFLMWYIIREDHMCSIWEESGHAGLVMLGLGSDLPQVQLKIKWSSVRLISSTEGYSYRNCICSKALVLL